MWIYFLWNAKPILKLVDRVAHASTLATQFMSYQYVFSTFTSMRSARVVRTTKSALVCSMCICLQLEASHD